MYTFDQYLKLSREAKSLATRYGCACLKAHLGALSAYDMKKKLLTDAEKMKYGADWLNKSSRFYNKKEQGEPIVRRQVVEDIDRRVQPLFSLTSLLCHPLWQLIDNPTPTKQSITEALSNLPHSYVQMLFKEADAVGLVKRKKLSRQAIWKIHASADIHALACLIAFCLESPPTKNDRLDLAQLSAIQYLIKLSIISVFSTVAEDFYILLNQNFSATLVAKHDRLYSDVWPYRAPDDSHIMLPMRIINNYHVNIAGTINVYKKLYQKAIQRGFVNKADVNEQTFYNFICHTEIQQLSNILYQDGPIPDNFRDLKHLIFERTLLRK
ncbi:hypothetical protein AR688_01815 [Rheinheimera sp. EpRS3]|nr:hypothetical protein AR688_01815 [Rheinheimera sp. EpRS3]